MYMNEIQPVRPTKDLVGRPVEVRVLFRALSLDFQGFTKREKTKFSRLAFEGVPNVCPILRKVL
jgi:hypothetical protein